MKKDYETFDIDGLKLFVSIDHRFGTDAVLLADFVKPLKKHIVCDLCTGCGIIPMLLLKNDNAPKKIYAVDIAEEAHDLLKESVRENGLEEKICPIHEDLKNITLINAESVDIITVNPPYYKKGSGSEKLSIAQRNARHEILCDIDDVIKAASKLLKYGGTLKLCHIPERLADVVCAMRKYGIEPKKLVFVSSGKNKPWLFLISGKKGAKAGLIVETKVQV